MRISHGKTIFALLPAAGRSTRMGRPKLSLLLGERTVIEHVVGTLRVAGIEKILIVVGPHVHELVRLAAGAETLLLPRETPDMRSTVEEGLRWIEMNWQPTERDAFLLVPADHPALDAAVVRQLIAVPKDEQPPASRGLGDILIPTYQGRRGHPTLIGWRHVPGIRALPRDLGLNAYLRQHADDTREVPVSSETILLDLDTPADYVRLQAIFG